MGSYTKKLRDHPALEARLWEKLRNSRFEERCARKNLALEEAVRLLDCSAYFDIMDNIPQPRDIDGVAHYMLEEGVLARQDDGLYAITNLGALLLAKRLSDFPKVARKAVRVAQYRGDGRLNMLKNETFNQGYLLCFGALVKFIEALTPSSEDIPEALREKKTAYPTLAIRESIANALIHQDFTVTGTGPVVEVFDRRIEITNPGTPLVAVERIIDNPPKSRNEKLAALTRRLKMCEELGTGWDKIVTVCEAMQLPAPRIELYEDSTKVPLFAWRPFAEISLEDKLWACYLHSCLRQVQGQQLTNGSFRERFGLPTSSSGAVSRIIKEAVARGLIKPLGAVSAPRRMKYVPNWS